MNLDPRRTFIISGLPNEFRANKAALEQSISLMCSGLDFTLHVSKRGCTLLMCFLRFLHTPTSCTVFYFEIPSCVAMISAFYVS